MGWFGSDIGDTAKGVGEGISDITSGIRHMFTGDIPPDVIVALQKIDEKANELVTQRWISDNGAGWAKYVRPYGFILTITTFVALCITSVFIPTPTPGVVPTAETYNLAPALSAMQGLLMIMVPAYYGARTIEKIKGATK